MHQNFVSSLNTLVLGGFPVVISTGTMWFTLGCKSHCFGRALQHYHLPADWARVLFKLSMDSASLLIQTEKIFFCFECGVFFGRRHNKDIFLPLWPNLPGPGWQPNGLFFWLNLILNLDYHPIFRALDWVPSISGAKIMTQKPKIGKNSLGRIPPQAITRQAIELESCSSTLKMWKVL